MAEKVSQEKNHTGASQNTFEEELCRYIEKSGMSVKKLSAVTGLGRTAIQHTMTGKLLPARTFVERLCAALPITHEQRELLIELYARKKAGDKVYSNRCSVLQLIESLPQYRISDGVTELSADTDILENCSFKSVSGIMNVNILLRTAMFREAKRPSPTITAAMPFEIENIYDMMIHIFSSSHSRLHFEHYFRMYACAEGEENVNIGILKESLKVMMCSHIDYCPYYHYIDREWGEYFIAAYPYFMVTSEFSALISSDFTSAMISDDSSLRRELLKHAEKIRSRSSLLISQIKQSEIYDMFADITEHFHSSIEFQPCFTGFFTEDILSKRLADVPHRDELMSRLKEQFFSAPKPNAERVKIHFTEEGLLFFVKTGRMTNIAGMALEPMSRSERIYFLESMKQMPDSFILLSDGFSVPSFMQVICLSNGNVIISCLMEEKKFCCLLTEQGLCGTFEDFTDNLSEMGFTKSNEILTAMIDSCIEMLKRSEVTESIGKSKTEGLDA